MTALFICKNPKCGHSITHHVQHQETGDPEPCTKSGCSCEDFQMLTNKEK